MFWTALGEAIEEVGLEAALESLAERFASLSSSDRAIMYRLNNNLAPNKSSSSDVMIKDLIEKFSKPARA